MLTLSIKESNTPSFGKLSTCVNIPSRIASTRDRRTKSYIPTHYLNTKIPYSKAHLIDPELEKIKEKYGLKQPSNQQPSNQQPPNQQYTHQQPFNQLLSNQKPSTQQSFNQQLFNQELSNHQPFNQQLSNQQSFHKQLSNRQPSNHLSSGKPKNYQTKYKKLKSKYKKLQEQFKSDKAVLTREAERYKSLYYSIISKLKKAQ